MFKGSSEKNMGACAIKLKLEIGTYVVQIVPCNSAEENDNV